MIATLSSWFTALLSFIKEAARFYYRLATNKAGLPKWLWLLMIVSWIVVICAIVHAIILM